MHVYIYEMNTLVDLMYWIVHEMIIFLSEQKKTYVTLSSIPPFIVTITTLVEYRCSFISRPDLFCDGKYIFAPTFETSVQRFFKGFLWFFKLPYDTFYPFPGWIKNRMFKNGIYNVFALYLKINMEKTSQKVTKDPKRVETARKGRENYK